jgi:hypothetical protein
MYKVNVWYPAFVALLESLRGGGRGGLVQGDVFGIDLHTELQVCACHFPLD